MDSYQAGYRNEWLDCDGKTIRNFNNAIKTAYYAVDALIDYMGEENFALLNRNPEIILGQKAHAGKTKTALDDLPAVCQIIMTYQQTRRYLIEELDTPDAKNLASILIHHSDYDAVMEQLKEKLSTPNSVEQFTNTLVRFVLSHTQESYSVDSFNLLVGDSRASQHEYGTRCYMQIVKHIPVGVVRDYRRKTTPPLLYAPVKFPDDTKALVDLNKDPELLLKHQYTVVLSLLGRLINIYDANTVFGVMGYLPRLLSSAKAVALAYEEEGRWVTHAMLPRGPGYGDLPEGPLGKIVWKHSESLQLLMAWLLKPSLFWSSLPNELIVCSLDVYEDTPASISDCLTLLPPRKQQTWLDEFQREQLTTRFVEAWRVAIGCVLDETCDLRAPMFT